jgi:predicted AAA+ superfamily ATPase
LVKNIFPQRPYLSLEDPDVRTFSFAELDQANRLPDYLEDLFFTGSYPRIYDKRIPADEWCANYVTTYLERDVRAIKNITDLDVFQRFLKMCAARSGQILNLSSLGDDCGIIPPSRGCLFCRPGNKRFCQLGLLRELEIREE